jgi:hypothetical protein
MTHRPLCPHSCTWMSAKSLAPNHPLCHPCLKSKCPSPAPSVFLPPPPLPYHYPSLASNASRRDLLADTTITHANTHAHACEHAYLAIRYVIPYPPSPMALMPMPLTSMCSPSTPMCTPLMCMQDSCTRACWFSGKHRLVCTAFLTHSALVKLTSLI